MLESVIFALLPRGTVSYSPLRVESCHHFSIQYSTVYRKSVYRTVYVRAWYKVYK